MPFYRNRFPPSSPNALCASALALRAPYDAQSVVNAQRYLPYTSRNKFRPLSGSIPERRRLVPDLDRRSQRVWSIDRLLKKSWCGGLLMNEPDHVLISLELRKRLAKAVRNTTRT